MTETMIERMVAVMDSFPSAVVSMEGGDCPTEEVDREAWARKLLTAMREHETPGMINAAFRMVAEIHGDEPGAIIQPGMYWDAMIDAALTEGERL